MFENGESYASFYQLRVVVRGISPMIWRRLEVPATTTIAGLRDVLQTVFGWSGEHLHRFLIHGCEFGISYVGGPGFRDDAGTIRLGDLGLRRSERFTYEYLLTEQRCPCSVVTERASYQQCDNKTERIGPAVAQSTYRSMPILGTVHVSPRYADQRKRRFCHRYIERPRRMRHLK
ncbi:MAG TPA: plasmid pRiA4b ORF-3 family protein [Aldersonia sp.]